MIKVIIADDELLEREVYKVIIKKFLPNIQIVAEAETGRQAIELYDIHKPDLMLMDMKMPGISGIEAIEEIRKRSKLTKFIVISAYNFFDFVKDALKYGVDDYILKPVAKDEFIKVVGRVTNKIDEEKKENIKELEIKERLKSILPLLENEMTFAIMTSDGNKIKQYYPLLNTGISEGYVAVGLLDEHSLTHMDDISRNLTIKIVQEYIKESIPELKQCLLSNFIANKMILVLPWNSSKSIENHQNIDIKDVAYKKMLRIRDLVLENCKVRMYFGIGECYKDISGIINSYNQALTVINNIDSFGIDIVNYGDIKIDIVKDFKYPYELEKLLIEKIRLGVFEQAVNVFLSIFNYITDCLKGDINRVKFEMMELYFVLSRLIYEFEEDNSSFNNFVGIKNDYYKISTFQEIYHIFVEDIKSLCNRFDDERNKKAKNILFVAIQYIKANYMNEITLEEVAKHAGFSPNYFSRLFKSEFNKSFIDYLTNIRVEVAKELVMEGDRNISDIAWAVGYHDPNYFTKVFKKNVGLAPSEYKEQKYNEKLD